MVKDDMPVLFCKVLIYLSKEIKEPNVNKNSQLFLNDNVGVSINPITGKLIQTNPI